MFDSVYFLTFGGWKTELQSNRWHYASRWARTLPVVVVEPTLGIRHSVVEPEERVANVNLLHVPIARRGADLQFQAVGASIVLRHMQTFGHQRPLLWGYNPGFLGTFAAVPAVARVYHATENYFLYDGLPSSFLRPLEAMMGASDLVIAVSGGVALSITDRVAPCRVEQVSNGCDFASYASGHPDAELAAAAAGFARTAVYAGNINGRVNFELLEAVTRRYPDILFAFFGPTGDLAGDDLERWTSLRDHANVVWFGPVTHERLPDVYAAADLGLMPYKATELLVNSGFPLKALEMAASGLPSIATKFVALQGLAGGIVVTETYEDFVAAVSSTGRSALTAHGAADLRAVASANDYDVKFDHVTKLLESVARGRETGTKLDPVSAYMGAEWTAALLLASEKPESRTKIVMKDALFVAIGHIPRPVRALVPRRLRKGILRQLTQLAL